MDDSPNSHINGSNKKHIKGKLPKPKKLTPIEDAPQPSAANTTGTKLQYKRDLIEAVRRVNPTNMKLAPPAFWNVESNIQISTFDSSNVQQQLQIVENGVNYSARRFNDLKVKNELLTRELKRRLDELDEQKNLYERLAAMKNSETDEASRIDQLHKEIGAVQDEINAKSHYSRQLEHMLQRLKRNQLKFDSHLIGMEQNLFQIQKEESEISLVKRALDASCSRAAGVLEETKMSLKMSRDEREALTLKRQQEYKNAKLLEKWLRSREEVKAALILELRGDLTKEEENFLTQQIEKLEKQKLELQRTNGDMKKTLQNMDDTFAQLKQVTGVSLLEDMIDKVSSQRNNKKELDKEVKEIEKRLQDARRMLQSKEQEFQELKSIGTESSEVSRETIRNLEESITLARNEYKLAQATRERLSAVLLGLQQGSNGLCQRVKPFKELADYVPMLEFQQNDGDTFLRETNESLNKVEQVLSKMIEYNSGNVGDSASGTGLKSLSYEEEIGFGTGTGSPSRVGTPLEISQDDNNIRIMSRFEARKEELKQMEQEAADISEDQKASKDEDAKQIFQNNIGQGSVDEVNTAIYYKAEARKLEAEHKRKIKNEKSSKLDGDNSLTDPRAAQIKTASRLSTTSKAPNLPDGVKIRDNILDKTRAFLNNMPNLA